MTEISEAFKKDEIIPDLIDTPPVDILNVKYEMGEVHLGKEFTPAQVRNQPTVNWSADPNKFYLLIMLDLDPPGRIRHYFREINHWMIVNIPGSEIDKGQTLASYHGAGPPPGGGLHRYVFLVYEQPGKLEFTEVNFEGMLKRMKFNIRAYAQKYNLSQPIAGNYFQAQYQGRCLIA